jgi:hypothetical protein
MYEQLCAILDELTKRGYKPQVKLDSTGISFTFRTEKNVHVDHKVIDLPPEKAADLIENELMAKVVEVREG